MVFRIILFCSMLALGASTGFPPGGAPIFLHLVPHAYKPAAAPPVAPPVAPAPAAPVGEPSPFSFMYSAVSGKGTHQGSESGQSSGKVTGSYSLTHKDGKRRKVDYTASKTGFSALIHTNEQGIKPGENPADVKILSLEGAAAIPQVTVEGAAGPAQAPPSPFSFMYTAAAGAGSSSRSESGDTGGNVKGTYSLDDEDGRKRIVDYTAGSEGFMAKIQTNEPGIVPGANPNNVEILSIPGVAAIPAAAPAAPAPSAPAAVPALTAEVFGPPSPFDFMYTAAAGTGSSSRSESGDTSGNVKGTYSLDDEDGRKRIVDYTAGAEGFMAKIHTNEPGIVPGANPNNVEILSIPGVAAIPAAAPAPSAPAAAPAPALTAEVFGPPSPFSFMYTAAAGAGSSSRSESGDTSGKVKGTYSLDDEDGRKRIVDYTAGAEGFMAKIQTNEPGIVPGANPNNVEILSIPGVAAIPAAAPAAPAPAAPAAAPAPAATLPQIGDISPFSFMYTADAGKGSSSRSETGDAGIKVKGSYSLKHPSGHQRIVDYSANGAGFLASVKSNEPGVEPGADTADVKYLPLSEVFVPAPAPASVPAPAPGPISAKELFAAAKHAPVSPAKLANYVWYPTSIVIDQ
uniref:Cuticular protein n=1 Tax=Tachypleus tridentatus TaxID=6853 RepID=Q3V6T1_TACTR|nr:cuticular protein [Tachypleus tridentatus]